MRGQRSADGERVASRRTETRRDRDPGVPATRTRDLARKAPALTLARGTARPFVEILSERGMLPEWLARRLQSGSPEDRIPVTTSIAMLESAVALTGDPDLGLHAALRQSIEPPLLEYAAGSCATVRESLETIAQYIMILNEGWAVGLRMVDSAAIFEFTERVPMGRLVVDFTLATFYLRRRHWGPPDARLQTKVCFRLPEPADRSVYERVFADSKLVFNAPFHGFVWPTERLALRMKRGDPKLHALLVQSIEQRLAELPSRLGLAQRVRTLLRAEMDGDGSSSKRVAERLGVSPRTLTRGLEAEGTHFKALLDEVRCGLAARYLSGDHLAVPEVARRLGFASAASFYKAFRRWFGVTPSEYVAHRNT